MSEYIREMMKRTIEANKDKLDCTVCTQYKVGFAYYFCMDGGKHIIDDNTIICDAFVDKRKKLDKKSNDKINLGTKRKCCICKKMFLYKDLIRVPKTNLEQSGFDSIFNTGNKYYCKKCKRVDLNDKM